MSALILEIRDLRVWFGNPPDRVDAVKGVDLTVGDGEVVGLIGENGAGKSTILNVVGALDRPDAGSVQVDGREVLQGADGEHGVRPGHFVVDAQRLVRVVSCGLKLPLLEIDGGHIGVGCGNFVAVLAARLQIDGCDKIR